jgi:hypothetical protein
MSAHSASTWILRFAQNDTFRLTAFDSVILSEAKDPVGSSDHATGNDDTST